MTGRFHLQPGKNSIPSNATVYFKAILAFRVTAWDSTVTGSVTKAAGQDQDTRVRILYKVL